MTLMSSISLNTYADSSDENLSYVAKCLAYAATKYLCASAGNFEKCMAIRFGDNYLEYEGCSKSIQTKKPCHIPGTPLPQLGTQEDNILLNCMKEERDRNFNN